MRQGISDLVHEAGKKTADTTDDPDVASGIPLAFFQIESRLLAAWQVILATLVEGGE